MPFTKMEADEAETVQWVNAMYWEKAEEAQIRDFAYYLVQTNGHEWHDLDLVVMRGIMAKRMLQPQFVRGRPVWIARISRPPIP